MAINHETVIAANRFGMGAKQGELKHIGSDSSDWLLAQLKGRDTAKDKTDLPSSQEAFKITQPQRDMAQSTRTASDTSERQPRVNNAAMIGRTARPIYQKYVNARSSLIINSDQSFRERLVQFWSNHFAVSVDIVRQLALMPTLEFEAIRPNITGNFANLLIAVEQHPAMLSYLDNNQSIGPDSPLAKQAAKRNVRRKFDINENLAREILELHTLGVNGGYTQEDVTSLANVISGWSIGGQLGRAARANIDKGTTGEFYFNQLTHQPGKQVILGKTYAQKGVAQGAKVLHDLALQPSTARFLATKLARHFIADEPPISAIAKLEKAYLDNDGDLIPVYETLIKMEETWQLEQQKYKTPKEYLYSIYRSVDVDLYNPEQLFNTLTSMGQQPFKPGSPAGWPDTAADWSGGDALIKRIEVATTVGDRLGNQLDPESLALEVLGPTLSDHTKLELARAESGSQGIALLFASPEFLRR